MGFFSKLNPFKKKDDFDGLGKDLDLGKDFGLDQGPSPDLGAGLDMPQTQQPFQKYPSFQGQQNFSPQMQQPSYQPPYPGAASDPYIASKNLEVISSKLDALKASLDALNQRVANIESIARGEQEDKRRRYY